MLKLNSKRIIQIRDVLWLGKCYNDWCKNKVSSNDNDKDKDIGDSMEEYVILNTKESSIEKDQVTQEINQKIKRKVYREFKQLESSYNPDATRIINDIEQGRDIILDQANIVLFSRGTQFEPTNFEQDWSYKVAKDREKWRMAIKKEFNDVDIKKFWETINKEDITKERNTIKFKWIFKIKRNGIFRARFVACGYSQVPGAYSDENVACDQ
jgi:hypothetical protein